MNWLGTSPTQIMASLFGCVFGMWLYGVALAHGLEAPWIVGLSAGTATAVTSKDMSVMRGLFIGTIAVWCAAASQAIHLPQTRGANVIDGIVHFHESLNAMRFTSYLLAAAACVWLASRSLRSGARRRMAGS